MLEGVNVMGRRKCRLGSGIRGWDYDYDRMIRESLMEKIT